ncbi:hypothetical protein A2U01_0105908, partial [Trifolium medium]|nr:hypothetical protein [Trifolium medium]
VLASAPRAGVDVPRAMLLFLLS